jgi:hypothetical protein
MGRLVMLTSIPPSKFVGTDLILMRTERKGKGTGQGKDGGLSIAFLWACPPMTCVILF